MSLLPSVFAEGLTKYPVDLFTVLGFPVNNSMISAALVTVLIIIVVQVAMRKPKLIPSGLQNFVEWVVELLSNTLEDNLGRATMRRGFWYFAGLFVFIILCNFLALVPGVGTIGTGHGTTLWNFEVDRPFLRGANANVNLTAAYTAVFFFMWFYWCIRQLGFWGLLKHIFGSQVKFPNPFVNFFFIFVFFLVGWVEIFSIFVVRPIAFTFRLYGNIFGGEYLLDSIYKMNPNFAFISLVPFYFYELLVAVVQALVFLYLTMAFTGMFTNSTDHSSQEGDNH
jgi:F-type H+-transporting ATPase subunit a